MSHRSKPTVCMILELTLLMTVLPACSPPPTPASPTHDLPTVSVQRTTRTPYPTALPTATELSPTPQPVTEAVTIQPCVEDGTGDTVNFNELLASLASTVYEMDSYRYRTLYRYTEGDRYADDDLSVEVEGAHDGLLTSPVESIITFGSQSYERSYVVLTDLRSGSRTETFVTQDGFWVLGPDDPGWIAFEPATPADLSNLAEMFSPPGVLFMVGGGGSLAPGAQAEAPAMTRAETLDGGEVMHRCWILPSYKDYDFNAYLIHWENTYTFLSEAEVHLWTTKDDTQLVRLALTAKHSEERQGLSDYAEEDEYVQHDPARDFLLWMEILEVDTPVEIEPPPLDQVALTIPPAEQPAADIPAPYNDLPLPAGAERVGAFGEESDWLDRLATIPREYRWQDSTIFSDWVVYRYFQPGWYQTPTDRRPVYAAEIGFTEAASFYMDEMSRRGWQLEGSFLQLSRPALYLFFERDGVKLPVILEPGEPGSTRISAILPPDDDTLETILSGWTNYNTQNSNLSSDWVTAIAFDGQGRAWVGTYEGLSIFDGETWTPEKPGESVTALAADPQGRVWVAIDQELSVFDGNTWQTYDASYRVAVMAIDQEGRIWLGIGVSGVSLFDGKTFYNFSPGEIGLPDGHSVDAIASDTQSRVWIGTSGGGVYMFDGNAWNTILKAKSPPNTTYMNSAIADLAIDPEGRVWIGTGEGLSVFTGEDWITYPPENSEMPFQEVDAVAIDAYDRVWVGGKFGAVSVLETDDTWNTYTPILDAAAGYSTNALVVDPQGYVWVGTDNGLSVFAPPMPTSH